MWLTVEDDDSGTLQIESEPISTRYRARIVRDGVVRSQLKVSKSYGETMVATAQRRAIRLRAAQYR